MVTHFDTKDCFPHTTNHQGSIAISLVIVVGVLLGGMPWIPVEPAQFQQVRPLAGLLLG
jgi:hypothetical protein